MAAGRCTTNQSTWERSEAGGAQAPGQQIHSLAAAAAACWLPTTDAVARQSIWGKGTWVSSIRVGVWREVSLHPLLNLQGVEGQQPHAAQHLSGGTPPDTWSGELHFGLDSTLQLAACAVQQPLPGSAPRQSSHQWGSATPHHSRTGSRWRVAVGDRKSVV